MEHTTPPKFLKVNSGNASFGAFKTTIFNRSKFNYIYGIKLYNLMNEAPQLFNEQKRLDVLYSYHILDTAEETDFDELTTLAATICQVPIALISLVDKERQWFKSHKGLAARETPIEQSFCRHAIASTDDLTIIEDANLDDRFKTNPLVTGHPNITFYAGVPLINEEGYALGSLCVIDPHKKVLTTEQKTALRIVAKQVMDKLELRRKVIELKRESKARELSEARTRSLVEQAPMAIIVFRGKELTIESVNPPMLELLGKLPDIVDKPLLSAIPELKGQEPYHLLTSVFKTGNIIYGNDVAVTLIRNGIKETGYYNFTYAPLVENGAVTGVIDMAVNVTEQVMVRQASQKLNDQLAEINLELALSQQDLTATVSRLKDSEKSLQMLADNISQLAWMADETGYIFWYNKRWYDYTGTDFVAMQGWGWDKVQHPEHLERVVKGWSDKVATGEIFELTFPIKSKEGEFRWFLTRSVPLKNDDGKIIRWFGTNTDVTEQRREEQRKNDFIAMVSHELKTPLTSMNGYLQLLGRRVKTTEDEQSLSIINRANLQVGKMTKMINGFLDVSRFESGQININRSIFDMAELVIESEADSLASITSHTIIFAPVERTIVNADTDKIAQVIQNLINNAVKYSPAGTTIRVACETIDGNARVCVQDEGMGIKQSDIDKLFERFYRVESADMKTTSGFGIGLYVCAEIINRHQGKIWVKSEIGKGSTFYFSIPVYLEKNYKIN